MHLTSRVGKSRNRRARVAEAHASGAVAIEQRVQFRAFLELLGLSRDLAIVFVFFEKRIEVVEPIRIEQARRRAKWPAMPSCSGVAVSSSKPGRFAAQVFDDGVLRAGALGRPLKVMRFIHNQHVPSGVERFLGSLARWR